MPKERLIRNVLLDFAVLLIFGAILLSLSLWVEPFNRGYFQDDHSIRLPYKEQTVSALVLAIVGFAINISLILCLEFYRDRNNKGIGEKFFNGMTIPGWVWESYRGIGVLAFGAACQQVTSNFTKYIIGRLRPHFFDICQPVPVEGSTLNALGYIQEYSCFSGNVSGVKEARLSFPSAHSSFAMYSAVFFILYLQAKGRWRGSKLLRHGIQFLMLLAAWYVGLSRIVDHYHHWSDVLAGFVIGAVFAYLTFTHVLKLKKYGVPVSWNSQDPNNVLPQV